MRALRLPAAHPAPLWFRSQVPCAPPPSYSPKRSRWRGGHQRARNFVQPASLRPGSFASWTRAGSLVFPGHPSHAFARLSDPGRTARTSPFAVQTMLPPALQNRRLQREEHFEAQPRALASAAYASRRTSPPPRKARFRLAGCAFAGRVSNPLGRYERFQFTSLLLSRASHDAMQLAHQIAISVPGSALALSADASRGRMIAETVLDFGSPSPK
jgi:hypothetical protein